jgi:anaerobic selenocysteine-containing dehydrogenase
VFELEYALVKKMNLHQGYPFHDERSWIDFMVKPSGVSYDRLAAEQIVFVSPGIQYRKYEDQKFNTPTGKLEFYSHWFKNLGLPPLPGYHHPAVESMNREKLATEGFSLLGTSRRPPQFVHTRFKNLPKTAKAYPEPFVYLNPEDARKRGVPDGSEVEVKSPQGRIHLKAKVTEDTTIGLVWIDFGWGNPTDNGASINDLVNDQFMDSISGGTPHRLFACEVRLMP